MLDRALITLPLTGARPIDSYDPRFAELADAVLRGRYIAAAEGAARLLGERFYDVRLLSYFLYGVVVEQGVGGLTWTLSVVRALADAGWQGLGPVQSQQKHIKASVRWLFDAMSRRLLHLDDDPQGRARFMEEWDDTRRAALIDAGEALAVQLEGLGDLNLAARKLVSALRTLAVAPPPPLVEPTPPPAPPTVEDEGEDQEPAAEEDAEEGYDDDDDDDDDEPADDSDHSFDEDSDHAFDEDAEEDPDPSSEAPKRQAPPARAARPRLTAPPLAAAPAWGELLERLTLFEQLVEDGATTQAAVVADDIEDRLNHFDPRRYFPALFAGYYAALAENMSEIEEAWEDRESARWRVLRQLYQLDPERFRRAR
ncbi:MAG: hypothetical protein IPN01_19125 [Deltaproteobacteria bacterium]|nr:hypothetical protein [Deltaproteobacteria bacterium]